MSSSEALSYSQAVCSLNCCYYEMTPACCSTTATAAAIAIKIDYYNYAMKDLVLPFLIVVTVGDVVGVAVK
jgi:hypothetical protein